MKAPTRFSSLRKVLLASYMAAAGLMPAAWPSLAEAGKAVVRSREPGAPLSATHKKVRAPRGKALRTEVFANQETRVAVPRVFGKRVQVVQRQGSEPATALWQTLLATEAAWVGGAIGVDASLDNKLYRRYGQSFVDGIMKTLRVTSIRTIGRGGESENGAPGQEQVEFRRAASDAKVLMWGGATHGELLGKLGGKLKMRADVVAGDDLNAQRIVLPENPKGKRLYYVLGKSLGNAEAFHQEIFDMLRVVKAAQEQGVADITVVSPYLPYSRSDRMDEAGVAVGAAVLPKLLGKLGVKKTVFYSIHQSQETGFFQTADVTPIHLSGEAVLSASIAKQLRASGVPNEQVVVVAPDAGAEKRAKVFAKFLAKQLGVDPQEMAKNVKVASKERRGNETTTRFSAELPANAAVVVVDDETASGGTIVDLAKAARANGATRVFGAVSHLTGAAYKKVTTDTVDRLFVLDTLPQPDAIAANNPAVAVVEIGDSLADVIKSLESGADIARHMFLER